MFKNLRAHKNDGFTLIELLIVSVILMVIMGIAIPIYVNNKGTAVSGAARKDVSDLYTAIATGAENQSLVVSSTDGVTPLTGFVKTSAYSREIQSSLVYVKLNAGNYTYCVSESDGKGGYWLASDSNSLQSSSTACVSLP